MISIATKSLFAVCLMGAGSFAFADEEGGFKQDSLFSSETRASGGQGGFFMGVSQLANKTSVVAGGQGTAIFEHFFEIGGAGAGVNTRLGVVNGKERFLNFGYGGLLVGVTPCSDKLFHGRAHVLVGGGGSGVSIDDDSGKSENHSMGAGFGVVEPSVGVELNLFKHGRIYADASWRQVWGGATVDGYTAKDFSSWSAVIGVRFGTF